MAYTVPASAVTNDLAQAAWMNTNVIDNIKALKDPAVGTLTASGYSTTSTSFVDMDATAQISLTTYGGHLLFLWFSQMSFSGSPGYGFTLRFLLDGSEVPAWIIKAETGAFAEYVFATTTRPTAGAHVIKPQWKVTFGTVTATLTVAQLRVMEIG